MGRKFWVTLTLGLITTCSSSSADSLSLIGLCNPTWNCKATLQAFRGQKEIRVGWLENSFGTECRCANRLLKSSKPKVIRVHLANGPCLRNKRCGKHEVFAGETIKSAQAKIKNKNKRLLKRFKKVARAFAAKIAESRGELTCYVSPVLESDFDGRTRKLLRAVTARYLPNCSLVDNPLRGTCLRGDICERHGPTPNLSSPCIADLDGVSADEVSVSKFVRSTKACDMSFIWTPAMNCNQPHSRAFVDPKKRNCEPYTKDYRAFRRWLGRE